MPDDPDDDGYVCGACARNQCHRCVEAACVCCQGGTSGR